MRLSLILEFFPLSLFLMFRDKKPIPTKASNYQPQQQEIIKGIT
jgi:hypothetical protein